MGAAAEHRVGRHEVPALADPMPVVNIRVPVSAVMKTLAQEYGPFGITANVIATGPFDSELSP
jgi:3-oxoacyl-[acyl-carrier protein] reductase